MAERITLREVSRDDGAKRIVMRHEASGFTLWIEQERGDGYTVAGHDAGKTEEEAKAFATTYADDGLKRHGIVAR